MCTETRAVVYRGGVLFVWMAVIFSFSSLPGNGVAVDSPLWYVADRKGAHLAEFALLTTLAFSFLRSVFLKESWVWLLGTAAAWAVAYGALDELHQAFVFGRGSHFSDVLIDALGAWMATLYLGFFMRTVQRKEQKKVV